MFCYFEIFLLHKPIPFIDVLFQMAKKFITKIEMETRRIIGTHDDTFHCDEILACFMLLQLPEYQNAKIVRFATFIHIDPSFQIIKIMCLFLTIELETRPKSTSVTLSSMSVAYSITQRRDMIITKSKTSLLFYTEIQFQTKALCNCVFSFKDLQRDFFVACARVRERKHQTLVVWLDLRPLRQASAQGTHQEGSKEHEPARERR